MVTVVNIKNLFKKRLGGQFSPAKENILDNLLRILVREELEAEGSSILWNGKDRSGHKVAPGVNLYCLKVGSFIKLKRILLLN